MRSQFVRWFLLGGLVLVAVGCGKKISKSERTQLTLERAIAVLRLERSGDGLQLAEVMKVDDSFPLRQNVGDFVKISATYQEEFEGYLVIVGPFVENDLFDYPMSFGEYPIKNDRVSGLNNMSLAQIRSVLGTVNHSAETDDSVRGNNLQSSPATAPKSAQNIYLLFYGISGLLFVLWLVLTVLAVIGCARHEKRTAPLVIWMLVIFWITPVGPVIYLLARSLPRRIRLSADAESQ